MNIFLDNIVFTIQQAGGVSVYWYELLRGICDSGWPVSFLNAGTAQNNLFEQQIDYRSHHCIRESRLPARYLRYLPLQCKLPPMAVFHGGYLRVSPQKDVVNMLTVHDFAHERMLASRFPRRLANTWQKAYGIKKADGIICISESTKQELLHFYPATDPAKLKVIHHGIADDFYPLDKTMPPPAVLRAPYILYVGGRKGYKNFSVAVAAVAALLPAYHLVAAGGGPWSKEELQLLEDQLPGHYHLFPVVSTVQLNELYNHAFCLLYPSVYEGFGFLLGDAMKAGCPVVSTPAAYIPKVVGTAGWLADSPGAEAFITGIKRLEDEGARQQYIQRGQQQVKQFSWKRTVKETLAFYQHCWNYKFSG